MGGVPSVLLLLWCRGGCSTATVAAALTFFPPSPPCYTLRKKEGSNELELVVDELLEASAPTDDVQIATVQSGGRKSKRQKNGHKNGKRKAEHKTAKIADGVGTRAGSGSGLGCGDSAGGMMCNDESGKSKKGKGSVVPIALYRREGARFTVVYSHGNATDIGAMHDRCAGIADALGANVLAYDYTGYGIASGSPTEKNTYRDIEAVCSWARANILREGEDGSGKNKGHGLILYGQSVGSGPTCYLAAEEKHGPFAGVVLHSPIMSGMRVLTDSRALSCLDIYPNVERITRVKCPVMVMHGMKDEEVPWEHGKGMYQAVPEALRRRPWWVRDRGHNDICEGRRHVREYYARLNTFVKGLEDLDDITDNFSPEASLSGSTTKASYDDKPRETKVNRRTVLASASSKATHREQSNGGPSYQNAEEGIRVTGSEVDGPDRRSQERERTGSREKAGGSEGVGDKSTKVSDSGVSGCQHSLSSPRFQASINQSSHQSAAEKRSGNRLKGEGKKEIGEESDLGLMPTVRSKNLTISTIASGDSSSIFASTGVISSSSVLSAVGSER